MAWNSSFPSLKLKLAGCLYCMHGWLSVRRCERIRKGGERGHSAFGPLLLVSRKDERMVMLVLLYGYFFCFLTLRPRGDEAKSYRIDRHQSA
jgi:hypothetical protein